jgi:uncharacterized damage-inducible protein DinB
VHEVDRIVDQMMRAHAGDSWTDVSLVRLLEGVTSAQAAAKPIPGAHSIWEIVLHLITTQEYIVDLARGTFRPSPPGEAWPPVGEATEKAWAEAVDRFRAGEAEVRRVVSAAIPDELLDEPLQKGGTSAYNNLHGYIQHAFYHGGQISVLRKLAS